MNSKEIKIEHFLVASLRVVQYWNKFHFPISLRYQNGTYAFILKNRTTPKQKEFFIQISEQNGRLLLFQKHQNETKAKEIDIINI
jgi:hypothetical protein